jgi:deubiquitinase DESI2
MAGRSFRGANVIINVYDLSQVNAYSYEFGVGAFHSGVEVMGTEYTFGGHESSSSGIFTHAARQVRC